MGGRPVNAGVFVAHTDEALWTSTMHVFLDMSQNQIEILAQVHRSFQRRWWVPPTPLCEDP